MGDKKKSNDNYFEANSKRHHYIPKFYIKGFTNSKGELYVYDKRRDTILNKTKVPKAIFFEENRNTLFFPNNSKSTIIEDLLFRKIDQVGNASVKYFQETQLNKIQFTNDTVAQFHFFLITLFWRIPATDYASNELLKGKKEMMQKLLRSKLPLHTINELFNSKSIRIKSFNIHQYEDDTLVIGDNPLMFRKDPSKFSEFDKNDFLIALNSRRIYASTNGELKQISTLQAMLYNAAIIDQSLNYVCCSNKKVIEKSIELYKMSKNEIISIQEFVFRASETK